MENDNLNGLTPINSNPVNEPGRSARPEGAADVRDCVRKPTHSFLIKSVAVTLLTLLALLSIFCALGAGAAYLDRAEYGTTELADSRMLYELVQYQYNRPVAQAYCSLYRTGNGIVSADELAANLDFVDAQSNYRYVITDDTGEVLASNIAGQNVVKSGDTYRAFQVMERTPTGELTLRSDYGGYDDDDADAQSAAQARERVTLNIAVRGYLLDPLAADDDIARALGVIAFVHQNQTALWVGAAAAGVLAIMTFIFLLCAAGRHRDSLLPRRGWIDYIPFDVLLVLSLGALALDAVAVAALASIATQPAWLSMAAGVFALVAAINLLWGLMICMTLAARIKTHTLLRNNVCVYVVRFCYRIVRGVYRWLVRLFAELPLLWRGVVAFFATGLVLLITFVGGTSGGSPLLAVLCLAAVIALFVLLITALRQADALKKGGEALARGAITSQIDTKGMFPDFRAHGENLNSIAAGMNRAVNERMASERMKTDLITNVSHDLKTPLTSIVSFIDLLKKEELHNATASGYVAVLDRQAERLKKLTTDLVEASKASSGAIRVDLARTDIAEALGQSLAEYGDRLELAGLTSVVSMDAPPLCALCDGRLLWRVFDNLLNNIVKYGQPGTRVYIDACKAPDGVRATFKNVSREPLNIPAPELTERFVRGDASRSSEGSGLGLSIARSLVELQKGRFALTINGDLFTAELILPAAAAPESAPAPEASPCDSDGPRAAPDMPKPVSDSRELVSQASPIDSDGPKAVPQAPEGLA